MKKIRLLIVFSLITCCLAVFSSCNRLEVLEAPTKVEVDQTTLTLSWSEVKDARLYSISIEPKGGEAKEVSSSKTTYSLTSLAEGDYQIKVKAVGKEDVNKDSEWSEAIPFTREHEPGMVFTLINGNTEYEVTDKGLAAGDIVIPDTYRGKPVTAIGKEAFFNRSDVASVTMGNNIKTIGDFAFANCSYVTSITIPASVTSIGESAFASCRLLEGEIVIPDGVAVIPTSAFAYCGQITGLKIGKNVTTINANAFTDCRKLTSISIPDSVLFIDEYAFAMCVGVTELDLGNGIETVGPYAFSGMSKIEKVTVPNTVKNICEGAFMKCNALATVELGSGVEMIDLGAFAETALWENTKTNEVYVGKWFLGLKDTKATLISIKDDTVGIANFALYANKNLPDIILPNSVKSIGNAAFANASFNNIVIGNGVEIIGEQAFLGCKNLSTVILGSYDFGKGTITGSNLKNIESYAFKDCSSLEKIEIPETVKSIGSYAFRGTKIFDAALNGVVYAGNWVVDCTEELNGNVEIVAGTVGIANYAFYKCTGLTGITLPNSIKNVGRAAFYSCSQLTSVTLPNTLETIEDYTFYHCDRLNLFELPPMLKTIGRSAFYKCGSILSIDGEDDTVDTFTIPSGVTWIGDYAFYGCGEQKNDGLGNINRYGVENIIIGDSVKTIGNNAFYGFVSLKKLVIGNSVEVIGEKAFHKCDALEEVTFGENVKVIGDKAFYKCEVLKSVALPNSVISIGSYAFYKCSSLASVELGNGVTEIGNFAFYGCGSISDIEFSSNLVHIGKQAFRNCKELTNVVLGQSIKQIDAHAFYGCDNLTLYVEGTKAGEEWHKYWNSSYRPTIWGCVLSEDKDYVVSFVKNSESIVNKNTSNTISAPTRKGYTFMGWNTNSSVTEGAYTTETFINVTDGRKLFAIWAENN